MCNGYVFKDWQVKAIESLLKTDNIKLSLFIINAESNTLSKHSQFSILNSQFSIFSYPYKHLIWRIYKRFCYKAASEKLTDIYNDYKDVPSIKCQTIKKGKYSEYFSEEDLTKIKSYNLDFIIRFGFNIIRGEILNAAKYGVWSYHHDNELKYRGGPPGFWEIFKNDNVNAVVLQRLTDKLDAGIILKKGYFKTIKHSYSANVDNIFYGASEWIKQLAVSLQLDNRLKIRDNDSKFSLISHISSLTSDLAKVFTFPNNCQMSLFLLKLFVNKLKFHYKELFRAEQWNIGIINKPISSLLSNDKLNITWCPKQKGNLFRADPFGYLDSDKLNILFEDYDYNTRKGVISKYTVNGPQSTNYDHQLSIEKPYHLAYPYVFNIDNEIYCLPECSEDNRIDLYKIDSVSGSVSYIKTLIEDIDAIDSTLFQYKGLWWIFCTRKQYESNTNLFAYYSDRFDGEYKPHFNNPVKTDISSARPAGTPFKHEGNLYRPSQDSSVTYGGSVKINRILKLNPNEFEEETIKVIKPDNSSIYKDGLHTISSAGDYTIVDGKRMIFVWHAFIYQLKRKIFKKLGIRKQK